MPNLTSTWGLYEALKAEGYELPKNTSDVRLIAPIDGIVQLHLTVLVDTEELQQVGRALIRLAESQK